MDTLELAEATGVIGSPRSASDSMRLCNVVRVRVDECRFIDVLDCYELGACPRIPLSARQEMASLRLARNQRVWIRNVGVRP
jgi:hypothetical protein